MFARDFSIEALAVETAAQHAVSQPLELEFRFGDQALILRGTVVRTERLPAVEGVQQYLTVVQLAGTRRQSDSNSQDSCR